MVVIGAGRIGRGLRDRAEEHGEPVTLVDRGSGWDPLGPGPLVVAVRNDDLDGLLARVPEDRRPDLVFVQNGALREFLAERGLADATRGVLYVMATGQGPMVPGGISAFAGPQALAVARWFGRMGVPSDAVDRARFGEAELEKLLWLAAFGPLCDALQLPVGVVATDHRDRLRALVLELAAVGEGAWGIALDPDVLVDSVVAYALAIPAYKASVKEWRWRNGWLRDQARRLAIPTPIHDSLVTPPPGSGVASPEAT